MSDQIRAVILEEIFSKQVWSSVRTSGSWNTASLFWDAAVDPPGGIVNPDFAGLWDVSLAGITPALGSRQQIILQLRDTFSSTSQMYSIVDGATVPVSLQPPPTAGSALPNMVIGGIACFTAGPDWVPSVSAWFAFATILDGSGNPSKTRAYKSTDNMASWTAQDTSHEPPAMNVSSAVWTGGTFWDGVSTSRTVVYPTAGPPSANVLYVIEFNYSTSTWGAAHDPLTLGGPTSLVFLTYNSIAKTGNGDLYLIYVNADISATNSYVAVLSGGVWTSGILYANALASVTAMTPDPNGTTLHTIYLAAPGPPYDIVYQPITSGVLGASQDLSGLITVGNNNAGSFSKGIIFDNGADTFAFAFVDDGTLFPQIVYGTPLSLPVFTTEQITNVVQGAKVELGFSAPTSGSLYAARGNYNFIASGGTGSLYA